MPGARSGSCSPPRDSPGACAGDSSRRRAPGMNRAAQLGPTVLPTKPAGPEEREGGPGPSAPPTYL